MSEHRNSKRGRKFQVERRPAGLRTSTLERDLRAFLDVLCLEWGFCIPLNAADRIAQSKALTSAEFAIAVLVAEGMDSEANSDWFQKIQQRFADQFGASVAADTYQEYRGE